MNSSFLLLKNLPTWRLVLELKLIFSSIFLTSLLSIFQASSADLKADIQDLYITGAKEIELDGGRKAIIISVPFRQLKDFHKVQPRLVRELEKKFRFDLSFCFLLVCYRLNPLFFCSGRHVVLVAQRTILPKSINRTGSQTGPRARSRTLTAVHEAMLDVSFSLLAYFLGSLFDFIEFYC